jgi:hypothetical protein
MRTTRTYEGRIAALADADAIALADDLQAITQLEVVDLTVTKRLTGFTPIAAEANSAVAETASVRTIMEEGDYYTFNLPALKAAVKSGSNVNVTAALIAFLEHFDNGDGIAAVEGEFFVSDGEKLKEVSLEDSDVTGKINR